MALTCAELCRRLDADERLDTADVREHVASCVQCRRALERWRAVTSELRVWSEELPPPFLHARIMAGVRAAAEAQPRGWRVWLLRRPLWASSALAAAFVLVVASVVMLRAPLVTQTPASLDAARGGAPSAGPAAPPLALTAAESGLKRKAERQSPLDSVQARDRERSLLRGELPALQPTKELDRGVLLSERPYGSKKDSPERDATRPGQAQEPREVVAAPAVPAPAPLSRVFGGAARSPALETEAAAAIAESKAVDDRAAKQDQALERNATRDLGGPQAEAAVSRVRARLVPLAGGPVRSVEVSRTLLASGSRWIDVDAEGQPRVVLRETKSGAPRATSLKGRRDAERLSDESGDEQTLAQQDRKVIQALELPPGRYRLERIDQ